MIAASFWLIWAIGSFAFWYAVSSLLPGWRSVSVAMLLCVAALYWTQYPEPEGGLGYVLGMAVFLPAWFGTVGGTALRALTLWGKCGPSSRLTMTLLGAPIVAFVGYFSAGTLM